MPPLLCSQSSADTSLWWTNLQGEGQAAGEDDTPLTLLIHPGLSLLTPMQLCLPWNPNLIASASISTSAQGPETARQPDLSERHGAFVWLHSPDCLPPIIPPFKLQIKASSHMKCFWGLKLNYTTSTTTAATITDAAWWINIHCMIPTVQNYSDSHLMATNNSNISNMFVFWTNYTTVMWDTM